MLLYVVNTTSRLVRAGYTIKTDHTVSLLSKIIKVTVITVPMGSEDDRYEWNGIVHHILSETTDPVDYLRKLNLQVAIVIGTSKYSTGQVAHKIAQKLRVPFVYEVRGFCELSALSTIGASYRSKSRKIQLLESDICRKADRVICINDEIRKELVRRGIPRKKLSTIPFYVYDDELSLIKHEEGDPVAKEISSGVTVGYFGVFQKYERLNNLIEQVANLRPRPSLIICGNGPNPPRSDDSWVTVLSPREGSELERLYQQCDILVINRGDEAVSKMVMPMKLLDYVNAEKCVVCPDLPVYREVLKHNINGYLFNPKDGIARALETLMRHPGRIERLGQAISELKDPNSFLEYWVSLLNEFDL